MANRINGLTKGYQVAADDYGVIDGTTNATRAITPWDEHGQFKNALTPSPGIYMDGTTGGAVSAALTGQAIGTGAFSFSFLMDVPKATTSTYQTMVALSSQSTGNSINGGISVGLQSGSTSLWVTLLGTSVSNYNSCYVANLIQNWGGKRIHVVVVRNGSSAPSIYINGVLQATTESDAGTPPGWGTSVSSTYFNVGMGVSNQVFVGGIYRPTFYNLALSQADVTEIFEMNGGVPFRYQYGSQTNLISNLANDSAFTGASTDWAAGGSATVALSSGYLTYTATATGTAGWVWLSYPYFGGANLKLGKAYVFSGSITAVGGSPTGIQICDSTENDVSNISAAVGAFSVQHVISTANWNYIQMRLNAHAIGDSFSFTNISAQQVGAVVHLPCDDGVGYQLRDASTNKLHATATSVGVHHLVPTRRGTLRFTTSTSGNQQALGQNCIPGPAQVLRIRAKAVTGTPTVKVGLTSGAADFVAAVALSSSWKDLGVIAAAAIQSSDFSLWINSTTTDQILWDVSWEPLTN